MNKAELTRLGVMVKPLHWKDALLSLHSTSSGLVAEPMEHLRYRPMFLALGSGGTYREVWGCWVSPPYGDGVLVFANGSCEFATEEAAKAAAQADYEARILAALERTP